jgi:hypothetical protein
MMVLACSTTLSVAAWGLPRREEFAGHRCRLLKRDVDLGLGGAGPFYGTSLIAGDAVIAAMVGGNERLPRHWAKYANAANVRFKRTQTVQALGIT